MQSAIDKIWEADPVHATEDIYRRLLDALAPIARDLLGGGTKGQNNAKRQLSGVRPEWLPRTETVSFLEAA